MFRRQGTTQGFPAGSPKVPLGAEKRFFVEYAPNDHQLPELHAAAKQGNVQKIKQLLAKCDNANVPAGDFRFTPLHAAALSGNTKAAQLLLECGANPDVCEVNGGTPLMVAASYGHVDLVKLLIKLTKNVNNPATAKTIFGQYKNPFGADHSAFSPNLPQSVAGASQLAWMKQAILRLSHPSLREVSDTTPLHCASGGGHLEAIDALLQAGTDINSRCSIGTPLHAAAIGSKSATIKYLLSKGSIPTIGVAEGIASPLHWAAYTGDIDSVKLLVAAGCKLSAKASKYRDSTPLHWAAVKGDSPTIKFLISQGADVNAKCNDGSTPLHWGSCYGTTYGTLDLIQADADLHATADDGSTPLHWASYNSSDISLTLLMINGADKMARTRDGYTVIDLSEGAFTTANLGPNLFDTNAPKGIKFSKDRFRPPFW